MQSNWKVLLALFLCAIPLSSSVVACDDDDVDLQLNKIKSIQVAGGMNTYPEIGISLDNLEEPFKAELSKRGITIDQNNYDNVVSTNVEVAKKLIGTTAVYSVSLSFSYTEPCIATRIKLDTTCTLWEESELTKIFTDPTAINKYVSEAISSKAKQFGTLFDKK